MTRQATALAEQPIRFGTMIGTSPAMQALFDQIRRVAQTDATVLITGESGTGKELVAEAIHGFSPRCRGPYSAINMAAVPETLVESELFGHVKGSFTGAGQDRAGRFEAAQDGTLFIDEIGDLKLTSQAKLLRVLENRRITPVGGNQSRDVDVRVLTATNRRLESMVAEKRFREDLYYRLNVVTITLPPLRERREDIPVLARHFLEEIAATYGHPAPPLSEGLNRFLLEYDWPGNVRQLRNSLESMVVLAGSGPLTVEDLPSMVRDHPDMQGGDFEVPSNLTLEEIEKAAILQSLDRCDGNRTRAARSLDISVRTLQRKLKRWGLAEVSRTANGRSDARGESVVGA